ncbi:putative chromatin structure-remodeling complex protein [Clavispora lusitaniae]|uniref:Chromatin structure-remodeling complex protein n=3 Tax=Clavispora lusitaniae TaxID=36911 RepID=C4Y0K6_CLAL4|nr:uncharacterized protein CLUG_01738 [Clavispora lusitaniae ATCC 42720]KAF5212034.1 hypothetical protein E0198_001585 [Clavispora lusitaniae]EEQ37615.1 hypothetical protein CLUG_01738 [Clavispora lusitaniae ATCC 42720]KAF7583431.1 SWIRM domain family protein [Clavispora lusitaniae]OVF07470.1 putative chromatin structure-remodeling complex protein [Clavispora lusitaniae]QFZ26609.1 putative chromatin structure-remodeling complex protein [Clavispora lusitaniae]
MATPAESEKPETPEVEDTPVAETAEDSQPPKETEPVDLEKLRASFQEKAKTYLIEQSRHVVIPSFSKWFNLNDVHQIEKNSFPDFFPPKTQDGAPKSVYKTPETYRNMRDFMINTYRINPIEYLTVTAVRRNLAGDVASIIRIHRFLEKWGLINYQIDPRTKPSLVGPQYTGHFQITLDTPKGLVPFVPEEIAVNEKEPSQETSAPVAQKQPSEAPVKQEEEDISVIPLNMEVTRNIFDDSVSSKAASSVSYFCNETSNDVSDVRYHNLKNTSSAGSNVGNSIISKECFEQGLFPSNFVSSDFVKLEKNLKQSQWTPQEILLLLEGVEMYASVDANSQSLFVNNNGQWDRISEHVASKTREECLIKFLQLPIEDKYLHKLVKSEDQSSRDTGIDKDTIVQEVVRKLVESNEGKDVVNKNAQVNLQEAVLDQTNLINQVIELTLEKVDAKLKIINYLEADLMKTENLLNLQRKQALIERWSNFEKINQFKKENTHPELNSLLDDLLTPININEINKSFNKIKLDTELAESTPETDKAEEPVLPVSVTQPKAYQFWSA